MSAGNRPLVTAADNKIAPQYYNPTSDQYEHVQGKNGGNNVNVIESALPAGAATAAKQDQQTAQLEALNAQVATDGKLDLILSKLSDMETELEAIKGSEGIKRIDETVDVQLTGSNAQLLKEDLESTALLGLGTNYTRRWGATNGSTIAQIKPLDVSNYREKMIRVVNDHDVQIKVRFEAHKLITGNSPIYISGEWDVGAGSSVLISSADDPLLACPIIGLVAAVSTTASVQTGTVSVEFYAGGVV